MSIIISPNFTQRNYHWTIWKTIQKDKDLVYQYQDDGAIYTIWGYDGPEAHICKIWKGTVPPGIINSYSQVQNNLDKTDFENNWLSQANGTIDANIKGILSILNSTTTPLTANSIFQGSGEDVSGIVSIDISILSDQISAANGFTVQWSQDNITFDYAESFTILANTGQFYSFAPRAKYFRLIYTNGLISQTKFSLSTIYYATSRSTYVQNLDTEIPAQKAVDVVRAVLSAQKQGSGTNFINLQSTSSGLLKVSVDSSVFPAIGSATVIQKHNTGPVTATSISTTLTSSVHINNTIVVVIIQGQGTFNGTYTLADTLSNTYAKAAGTHNVTPSGSSIDVWYTSSTSSGACTITANNFSQTTNLAMQAYEVSQLIVGNSVDKIAASASLGTVLSVGPVITGSNGEFCIAAYGTDIASLITPGAGWTSDLSVAGFGCFSQIQSTAGSITGTAAAASSVNSIEVLVTFLPQISTKPFQVDVNGKLFTKAQLQSDDGYSITLGQKVMASSLPITIASDQSAIPVSGTITSNIGTTNGLALDTSINGILVAQNSTTSGEKGPLIQGAVTTSAPTYTTTQTSPLSLTTTGMLRIDGSGVIQPMSSTQLPAALVGGRLDENIGSWLGSTTPTVGQKTMAASIPVAFASNQTALSVQNLGSPTPAQTNVTITGNGSLVINVDLKDVPLNIVYEVVGPVTGTSPTLTLTATDLDPQTLDATTIITTGPTLTGITTPNYFTHITQTGKVRLSWVVGGTSPSFGGHYVTAVPRNEGSIGVIGLSPPNNAKYTAGSVTTSAPTYTTGTLNALSLTTAGALRIDGSGVTQPVSGTVTANIGTTNGLALDATLAKLTITQGTALGANTQAMIGGSVTTAAPTYTTGNINPLSLMTTGSLRIDNSSWLGSVAPTVGSKTSANSIPVVIASDQAVTVTGTVTAPNASVSTTGTVPPGSATYIGGSVTTAAPAYTTGQMNALSLTTTGLLRIDGSGVTQPVSGTVTANQGGTWTVQPGNTANTTPWLVTDSADGPVTPGAVAGKSMLIGGQFNTALPTLTNTQQSAIQLDSSGRMIIAQATASALNGQVQGLINAGSTVSIVGNPVLIGGRDFGGNAQFATLTVDNTIKSIYTYPGVNAQLVYVNNTIVVSGAAIYGGYGATQVTLFINVKNSPTGTAPTLQFTLQEVDPGDSTTVIGNTISSTIINAIGIQKITLPQTFGGNIKVTVTVGGTTPSFTGVYATLVSKSSAANIIDSTGTNIATVKAASTATVATDSALAVSLSPNSPTPVGPDTVGSSGTLNALNATAIVALAGQNSVGMQLAAGTLVGTIVPEFSYDGGTTWVATEFEDPATKNIVSNIVFASSNAATTRSIITHGGVSNVRVRVSVFTSGTANCTLRSAQSVSPAFVGRLTDGTNGIVGVTPSSTAPTASQPALVVTMSPNQGTIAVSTSPANSSPTLVFGDITLSSNAATVAIRRTTYTEQTTNFTGSIKSSSASDTAAGTGARTITIYYVDQTGATIGTETATLNGTTAVNLVTTTKCFIEKIVVNTVGSGSVNAGTISLFSGSGGTGTTIGTIAVGDNRTHWCHHYVITGKTCNVTNVSHSNTSSVSGGTSAAHIKALSIGITNAAEVQVSEFVDVGGAQNPSLKAYGSTIQVVGPARLVMYVLPAANTTTIYRGSIDCYDL